MKKERKLKLEMKKVSVSHLNNVLGGDDLIPSVNFLCVVTTEPQTLPGISCKTGLGNSNQSERDC
ncbi:hypothetical protein KORDIASMS9_04631 [Kordia sp. SMS9]|uniref:hypothetical protein n=1 Tax=Kordia sp. SMS9 TaxID=2282170 RepID=UPI000E0D3618|nr:hypothetical protein [Kordia sp. SMS9]AXG72360.1 hypothetical protein KORDIASMS9_04631 [Kordia sp. SMS9]